jgi:hypothetical protein
MTSPSTAPPSSLPTLPACEHCRNRIGPAATLARIGLTTCPVCRVVACDRCWGLAGGSCPACGVSLAAVTPAIVARPSGLAPNRSRTSRRARLAMGIVAFVALAFAFAFIVGNPFRPAAGVVGAVETPATTTMSSPESPPSTSPSLSDGLAGAPSGSPAAASSAPGGESPIPSAAIFLPSAGATATARSTLTPTPRPTPVPTPRPTPRPTATPGPSPCTLAAPDLVGEHRNSAQAIWSGAGFTGSVTILPGNGNYVIGSQDRIAGHRYPCAASVTVGP